MAKSKPADVDRIKRLLVETFGHFGIEAQCLLKAYGYSPGTIDAGYRGEIKVMLINLDPREAVVLRRGDRIAQLVVQRFERARFVAVTDLPESVRGTGGYGSTGGFGATPEGEGRPVPEAMRRTT